MELNQLRHFLTAARLRNLTLAARELDISQPALSKSIRLLEQQLGATLFERGRFGVRLTPLGDAVLMHSQAIEAQTQSLKTQVEGLKRGYSGLVRIGCGASAATALIPLALSRLAKKRPDVKFDVLYGLNRSLLPWVRSGEIEFALSFAPTFSGDSDLVYEPLYQERLHRCAYWTSFGGRSQRWRRQACDLQVGIVARPPTGSVVVSKYFPFARHRSTRYHRRDRLHRLDEIAGGLQRFRDHSSSRSDLLGREAWGVGGAQDRPSQMVGIRWHHAAAARHPVAGEFRTRRRNQGCGRWRPIPRTQVRFETLTAATSRPTLFRT
jgi:DNA-binding transcriptional LysR family regulator